VARGDALSRAAGPGPAEEGDRCHADHHRNGKHEQIERDFVQAFGHGCNRLVGCFQAGGASRDREEVAGAVVVVTKLSSAPALTTERPFPSAQLPASPNEGVVAAALYAGTGGYFAAPVARRSRWPGPATQRLPKRQIRRAG
jgi:hypothetical protein